MTELTGVHVPLVTPFAADGTVAAEALAALAEDALDAGAAGLVALGTTAETSALDPQERRAVIEVCAQVCGARGAPLIVGAGSADTRSAAAAMADLARWPEVSAALVTVPAFVRPSEAGVLAHFAALTAASPVPVIIYHIPYRTALPLSVDCLHALGRIPGIAGFKYAPGAVDAAAVRFLGDLPPDVAVLVGDDVLLAPLLALGAHGGILASAHLATGRFVELVAGRSPRLGHDLAALSAAAFAEPNPTVTKGALHALGRIPTPDVRLPLLPASRESVDAALQRLSAVAPALPAR